MRSTILNGLGGSGFQKSVCEMYKNRYLSSARKWRSYVDFLRQSNLIYVEEKDRQSRQVCFVDFESEEYGGKYPSLAYLLERMVLLIESHMPYYTKRMQMIDGITLSGDHSFKVAKVMSLGGAKPFAAMYTLMNEYGQVGGWWFTHGTSLKEIKPHIMGVAKRYKLHGFEGPEFTTSDRCCQEHSFWVNNLIVRKENQAHDDVTDADDDDDLVEVVGLPSRPKLLHKLQLVPVLVEEITEKIEKSKLEERVIAVDCEWQIGAEKADLLTIATRDGATDLFHLARFTAMPKELKILLENSSVQKVGNRVKCDVKKLEGWGVEMSPVLELGHLARARLVSPNK